MFYLGTDLLHRSYIFHVTVWFYYLLVFFVGADGRMWDNLVKFIYLFIQIPQKPQGVLHEGTSDGSVNNVSNS